jgi:hypothetical protein
MSSKNRLLWADDDADSLLAPLGRLLRKQSQLEIDVASDYDTAIHLLQEKTYSAAVIDTILPPGIRDSARASYLGIRLAQYISATYPDIKIALLSVVPVLEVEEQLRGLDLAYFEKLHVFEMNNFDRLVSYLIGKRDR